MKRFLFLLSAALLMTAVIVGSAASAFAAPGGGATKNDCIFLPSPTAKCSFVTTPSGNSNGSFHENHPKK